MGLILDSTAAVAAEREGKTARQLLESVALQSGDEEIALSVVTVLELAHCAPGGTDRPAAVKGRPAV
ncbi:MAG TPA: hypothetical protein VFQ79_25400 [Bryobacteraceae bacterium]|nr:hypothetical protein [Bryobacteraceae bacterium]